MTQQPRVTRRRALRIGGVGLVAAGAGAAGWWRFGPESVLDARSGAAAVEPPVLRSESGVLAVRLEAARGDRQVAGRSVTALGYNDGLPGPTLRVRPGDTLRIELVNGLDEPTNLHVHGLHVSPEGNGDNVFVAVQPGESFDYEHRLPDDHPPGVFWYHPHHHGNVADQVFGGLYGAIVVEDPETPGAATVEVARERVLVVSDISLDESGALKDPSMPDKMMGREGELVLVNGQVAPVLEARPGERERWRVVNACVSRYLALDLGAQQVDLVARDLGPLEPPAAGGALVLAPGNRADIVLTTVSGTTTVRADPVDRGESEMGGMGGMMGGGASSSSGAVDLLRLEVAGTEVPAGAPLPARRAARDLRGREPARRRELVFQTGMGMGGMSFTFGGQEFDPDRTDQEVEVGAVEDWTIRNDSSMDHPFHLHVWPMQVLDAGEGLVDAPVWRDVVNVPARGAVTVRVAFDQPGRTVYHCHILDHEDDGMMGVVRVG
ncbi:Multicopper oxidase mco [Nocardioides dokdonensis FR1436]|uniref:Multicopper oxidase mco n=1 Tax=Nocardioides dokdonensis FR1436 TaxID=1300347 RepID=A0A1A9GQ36_9ACTN|nr:multicopper oxidase family protein [Nocardioides dokdonensis]ANH40424.1 Multicopper oxidase mco [Nocardioides dokdonensis FR1436]